MYVDLQYSALLSEIAYFRKKKDELSLKLFLTVTLSTHLHADGKSVEISTKLFWSLTANIAALNN